MRPSWKYAQHLAPTVVPQSNYESPKKHINNINCNLKLIVLLLSLDHPKGFGSQNFGPKNQWQTKSVSPQYLLIVSSSAWPSTYVYKAGWERSSSPNPS